MVRTEPPSRKILLVEDDGSLASILADVLQDQGYQVVLASNGREALNYLSTEPPPRLVLLNLMMPTMNGWKLHQHLQRSRELAAIPIILLSGVHHLQEQAAALGAAHSFSKPYNLKALIETIQHYCRGSGPVGEWPPPERREVTGAWPGDS